MNSTKIKFELAQKMGYKGSSGNAYEFSFINFKRLIERLAENTVIYFIAEDFLDYPKSDQTSSPNSDQFPPPSTGVSINPSQNNVPYIIPETGEELDIEGQLCTTTQGLIDLHDPFVTNIDFTISDDGKLDYTLYIKFEKNIPAGDAIILTLHTYSEFYYLVKHLHHTTTKVLEENFTRKFVTVFDQYQGRISDLSILYKAAPTYAINKYFIDNKEKVFKNLIDLLSFDDKGLLSWFKDSSGPVINLLRGIGDADYLYTKFSTNQTLVKRIYQDMQGSSSFNDSLVENKMIFACLMRGLCISQFKRRLTVLDKTFHYGENYKIRSNVISQGDEKNDTIFLQEFQLITQDPWVFLPDLEIPQEKGSYYYPLDLVKLINADSSSESLEIVPAIYIKAHADEESWTEIGRAARIAGDLLGIILGVGALETGNPYILALSIADLGITSADLLVALNEEKIAQLEGGKEFLEKYNRIVLYVSIPLAGTLLIAGLFEAAPKLLKAIANSPKLLVKSRELVYKMLWKVVNELNFVAINRELSFIKIYDKVPEIIGDILKNVPSGKVQELLDKNVIFNGAAEVIDGKTVTKYIVSYKGYVLAEGETSKEILESMKGLLNKSGDELVEALEENVKLRTIFVKWANKFEFLHPHFDGEIVFVKTKDGIILKAVGGHNHELIGTKIIIREYLTNLIDDRPFEALISILNEEGKWIEKLRKSSMFPKNWDIAKVKQEIALVYDQMIESGFELKWSINKYTGKSTNGFDILIEVDKAGNIKNAYPIIN